jgi:ribonuclease P protein component
VSSGSRRSGRASGLRARAEFLAVQHHGGRASGRYLTVLGRRNEHGRDRLGIIASKRVGGAVQRNRAKRRIREIFRTIEITGSGPMDVVVIARPDTVTAPFAALTADFHAALKKLRGAR